MSRITASFLTVLSLALPLAAEASGPQTLARVEFAAGRIVIDATVPSSTFAEPRARYRAERDLESAVPDLFRRFAPSLVVDSWDTLGSAAEGSEAVLASVVDLSHRGRLEGSHMSEDLRSASLSWSFRLFGSDGLIAALVTHTNPFPLPRPLADGPTTGYSGVVIYAAEAVAAKASTEVRLPRPALFPRIYDTSMNLVLEKEMCDPESLVRWGMVAYTDDPSDRGPADRIGVNPLRVLARGLFGRNDTDLLIPTESARRLLATEDNRRLLREGRILVVYRDVSTALVPGPQ